MSPAKRRPPSRQRSPREGGRRPHGEGRGAAPLQRRRAEGLGGDQVEGRHAILELLEAQTRPTVRVFMAADLDPAPELDRIEQLCRERRVPLDMVSRTRISREAATESHQGVVAKARQLKSLDLEALVHDGPTAVAPFLLIADGITDPHNLGSLLRSAECAGVTGIVVPKHRAARITPTVTKVAAGAIEHLRFAQVAGIPTAIEQLKRMGVVVVGLAGESRTSLYDVNLGANPIALVIGSEDAGLAQLTRKRCSSVCSIPMRGETESLNASVAGAIAIFEASRQRQR